jgi:hypothetical protein
MSDKVKAPWEGSTPEEDAAYANAMQFDVEFEAEVANQMGPYGRSAIDASRADVWHPKGKKRRWTLMGHYMPDDFYLDMKYYKLIEQMTGEKVEPDKVVVVGTKNADKRLWAHEFRHRYVERKRQKEGSKTKFKGDMDLERLNRLWDAYLSQDGYQWEDSVFSWADWLRRERGEKVKYSEAESHLKQELLKNYKDFAEQEALADWRGVPYKVETDKYTEKFAKRALKWK